MSTDQITSRALRPVPVHRPPPPLHAERADSGLALRQIWFGALVVTGAIGLLL